MIPNNGNKSRSKPSSRLSKEDYIALSQSFEVLKALGDNPFTSVDAFIEWYINVFGQLALEMLIEDCKKALKEKDYKKMLAIATALASKSKIRTQPETTTAQVPTTEVFNSETFEAYLEEIDELKIIQEQEPELISLEVHEPQIFDESEIPDVEIEDKDLVADVIVPAAVAEAISPESELAPDIEITEEDVEKILSEYELYFNETELEALDLEETGRVFDESGHISFGEISDLVSSVENRLDDLVEQGDLTEEQAAEILAELKDIEVGKFASLEKSEVEQIISELPMRDIEDIQNLVNNIDARESVELVQASKMFGEEGFLNLDSDAFKFRVGEPELTFAQMEAQTQQFEAELIGLVENGTITSDQAYMLRDAVDKAPVDQAHTLSEAAVKTVSQPDLDTPAKVDAVVNEIATSEPASIVQQAAEIPEIPTNDLADTLVVSNTQEVQDLSETVAPTQVIGDDQAPANLIVDQIDPTFEFGDDFDTAPIDLGFRENVSEVAEELSVGDTGATVATPAQVVINEVAPPVNPITQNDIGVPGIPLLPSDFTPPVTSVNPVVSEVPTQQPVSENFVPVTLFQPGTRPVEEPFVAPALATDVAPNMVAQPQSFVKADLGVQENINIRNDVAPPVQQVQQQPPVQQPGQEPLVQQDVQPQQPQVLQHPEQEALVQQQPPVQEEPNQQLPGQKQQQQEQEQQRFEQQEQQKPADIRANEPKPEEMNFNKPPCGDFCHNDGNCATCGKLNAEHLKDRSVEIASVRAGISSGVMPPGPLQPNVHGLESRTLTQSGLGR